MKSAVSRITAAPSEQARQYFASLFEFETDCWDVHHAITNKRQDFILLDVRSSDHYERGHLPQSVSLPHSRIRANALDHYASDTLFVVYCAGPHCNGADKAALKIAELGRPVKKMIGGVTGWLDEGFTLSTQPAMAADS